MTPEAPGAQLQGEGGITNSHRGSLLLAGQSELDIVVLAECAAQRARPRHNMPKCVSKC